MTLLIGLLIKMSNKLEYGPRAGDEAPWQDEELLRELYVQKKRSAYEIGDRLDCAAKTVLKWLRKYDIPVRGTSESVSISARRKPASYVVRKRGYVYWSTKDGNDYFDVAVHRLLAVSEYGFDELKGKHVHHKNGVTFDNRPDNIELMTPSEHHSMHAQQQGKWRGKVSEEICETMRRESDHMTQSEIAEGRDITQTGVSYHVSGECSH
jgi:DNA-binding CsgD family transcriptional regulator